MPLAGNFTFRYSFYNFYFLWDFNNSLNAFYVYKILKTISIYSSGFFLWIFNQKSFGNLFFTKVQIVFHSYNQSSKTIPLDFHSFLLLFSYCFLYHPKNRWHFLSKQLWIVIVKEYFKYFKGLIRRMNSEFLLSTFFNISKYFQKYIYHVYHACPKTPPSCIFQITQLVFCFQNPISMSFS